MFNLSKHDAKFVEPDFFVDPLDERFTGINNQILVPLAIGIGAYASYKGARAAEKQAEAAREAARVAREAAVAEARQMKADAEQRAREFAQTLEQTRLRTAQAQEAAKMARESAMAQVAQQKAASALAIQQQQLQSAIQRQASVAPVAEKVRRRVGTPQALRTSLEIKSPLAGAGSGLGLTPATQTGTGGLNV